MTHEPEYILKGSRLLVKNANRGQRKEAHFNYMVHNHNEQSVRISTIQQQSSYSLALAAIGMFLVTKKI